MKVLVTGGTGFVGRNLCAELADRDHDVTALSRTGSSESLPSSVRSISGDVTDRSTLKEPIADHDVVVNLVSLSPLYKTRGKVTHESVHFRGTENLVRVAEEVGINRFVQQSALGADPNGSTAYIRAKGRAEEVVRDSDLDWVVVRPSVIFGEGGEFVEFTKKTKQMFAPFVPIAPLPGGGRTRFQPIWIGDFAPLLADTVDGAGHGGQIYELGGPAVLTLAEVTRKVFQAEGRSIRVVPIPMPLARLGMTVMEYVPIAPFGLDQYRSLRFDNTTNENAVEELGPSLDSLMTLDDYLGIIDEDIPHPNDS